MSRPIRDLTGQRFGKLLVLGIAGRTKHGQVTFHCHCDCSNNIVVCGGDLTGKPPQQSCGCYRRDGVDINRKQKKCSRCQLLKPIEDFHLNKRQKDGHDVYCIPCGREVGREKAKKYSKQRTIYHRERRRNDPNFRLACNLTNRIGQAVQGCRPDSLSALTGCSAVELKKHLERQFRPGMTWENYGRDGWQIDHIRPCASFDLTDPEQQKICFHYTNLQPLWRFDNQSKQDSIPVDGLSVLGGSGFIGSNYALQYPDCCVEPRNTDAPTRKDVLYFISTTTNYNVFTDLKIDINTNLSKLLYVLPHVNGIFNYISTWFVYGKSGVGLTPSTAAKETDPCDPNGFYSITKFAAERYVESYCDVVNSGQEAGPSGYRILRLCGVIGNDPGANKQKNALEYMIRRIVRGEAVNVYEGDNYRNIMHVSDVVRAINLCINSEATLNSIINIGAPKSERILDLIEYAKARVGSFSPIVRVPVPPFHQIVQVPDFWLCTDKLKSLGFTPSMTAFQAVDKVLEGILRQDGLPLISRTS